MHVIFSFAVQGNQSNMLMQSHKCLGAHPDTFLRGD